ncbi:MAG: dynamin family protein, partial [Chloroflexi bacterium]|nr:dynamin family protein [Chloroflexota bacterium]
MPEPEVRTFHDYARARGVVTETLGEVAGAADGVAVTGGGRLREAATRLKEGLFTILVLGDFKTGKSTFLNALLEQDVLPTAVTPCTSVLATIQYSPQPYVRINHFQGERESATIDEFAQRFCLSTREEENERFKDIEQIEIGVPAEICRDRVRIVDSPGLDESPQRTAITTSHIPRSDAAVFMMGADRLGREHEMEYLRSHILGHGLDNVFFVVNRCDLVEEALDPDREWGALRARAWQLLVPAEAGSYEGQDLEERNIYFLSARNAREAQRSGDSELVEQSGLPRLRERLEEFLVHDRGRVALQRPASLARETAEAVRRACEYRIRLMDVSLAELDDRIAQTQPDFERISRARAQAERVITSQRDRCRADLAVRLRQKIAELQDDMRRTVRKFDFPGADSVTGRLTASVKMEPVQRAVAEQLDRYLSAEFSGWIRDSSGTVQRHLEAMVDQLGDNARQVQESLQEIQLKIIGPHVSERAAEQLRDPLDRMNALQDALRQREFSTVLRETEDLWKGTARTFAAQFAGYLILGWLGLTNPITTIPTMVSIGLGMMLYNTNLAIDQLRESVADIARGQLAEIPEKTQPELDRQVDAVFAGFT